MTEHEQDEYDVVVIGGGAAGLSGALVLARSRRRVVVVDGGQPRNAPAAGVHGYLTRDGIPPAELVRTGRLEAQGYGARVVEGGVEQVLRAPDGRLTVVLAGGRRLTGRRLLVATGLVDELPDLPGLRERWGRDVLHCPYCHGWEVRDRPVAVLASGPMSVHQALLFRQLTDDVTYLAHARPPTEEQTEQLLARGIRVVAGPVAGLQIDGDRLTGVRLADGGVLACAALVVATHLRARAGFLAGIGLAAVEHPSGIAEHLRTDAGGRTDALGVWAAGNVTDPSAQVGGAAAAGAVAAAQINADLVAEDVRVAVEARRAAPEFGAVYWESRYLAGEATSPHDPSPSLVTEAADLPPGRALDAGCGLGADAIWLAERGWQVTAVDVSATALEHARRRAATAGPDVAARIDWVHADLTRWDPADRRFDLVTSHHVHVPGPVEDLVGRLASWVAPGGTLLVVGHDAAQDRDRAPGHHHAEDPAHRPAPGSEITARQVTDGLADGEWDVAVAETRTHPVRRPDSPGAVALHDTVVRARRRRPSSRGGAAETQDAAAGPPGADPLLGVVVVDRPSACPTDDSAAPWRSVAVPRSDSRGG